MAKTTKNSVPGLGEDPMRVAERIVRLLDESRAVTSMHTYEHFHRTVDIWLAALHQVKMGPWLDACAGMEKGLGPIQQALHLLMVEAMGGYADVIGSVYMLLSQGEKRLGQYFTPLPLARGVARSALNGFTLREKHEPPIRILEPCCGSGVMILACAQEIEARYPGAIQRGDVLFYGIDLDVLCVRMCQINMLLHGIGHVVLLPDDASGQKPHDPRYVFQPARIVCGNSLTQDTTELLKQEVPCVPLTLILPGTSEARQIQEIEHTAGGHVEAEAGILLEPERAEEGGQVAKNTAASHEVRAETRPGEVRHRDSLDIVQQTLFL